MIANDIKEDLVYCYNVCWENDCLVGIANRWLCKSFARKKDAQKFARTYKKKSSRRPYIDRVIRTRSFFKADIEVEFVKNKKEIEKYNNFARDNVLRKDIRY